MWKILKENIKHAAEQTLGKKIAKGNKLEYNTPWYNEKVKELKRKKPFFNTKERNHIIHKREENLTAESNANKQ